MRSRELDTGPYEGARFGVESGLVGIGGALDPKPESLAEATELTHHRHGPKAGRMLDGFAALPTGSYVWTRTGDDAYRLGRITGAWRYDDSPGARATGIHHTRPAEWLDEEFRPHAVPVAVLETYARGGLNFQRTRDAGAEARTEEIWSGASG
jgi:hypothetical protein